MSGLGRFCVPWSNWAHVPRVLKPVHPRARVWKPQEPLQGEGHTPRLESRPLSLCSWRKLEHGSEDPAQPEINKII